MKPQDLFRTIVDRLEGIEQLDGIGHTTGNPVNSLDSLEMEPVAVDNTDHTDSTTMIPKPEHDCGCNGECECHDEHGVDYEEEDGDELEDIQHLAGIPIAVVKVDTISTPV
jgi:hypothetical protein